ncbi:alpha/beta-hydrolase [Stipitochalara longipes BDJ]|nr:alpha/beta-hydrolase [Stipitochalara longipes BDJ]
MDLYSYSHFSTSRGLTYSYIHLLPVEVDRGYILFLHGFPSSSYDWRYQIAYFKKRGYGIIVPDLLGYGGTSKPLETSLYNGKGMSEDIKELLSYLEVDKVIGVAHDWGSFLLSRLVNYYPSLFSKLVFVDVGYNAPGHGLTEATVMYINSAVQSAMGYSVFGYFLFFNEADAAAILDAHPDSAQTLFHSRDDEVGKKYMGAVGGIRSWLEEGRTTETGSYFTLKDLEYNRKLFAQDGNSYGPPINWYKAVLQDINNEDEKAIPQERYTIQQPTLLLAGDNFISATADFPNQMKSLVPLLDVKRFQAGHWIQLEKPEETNFALETFFKA